MEKTITDMAPKPSGLLPKNLQAFILVGLALAMVVIMAVTGHKRPAIKAADENVSTPAPASVNASKVLDFQKGIEQTQQESAPQAEAALLDQQRQLAAQGKWPGQPAPFTPYGSPASSPSNSGTYPPAAYAAVGSQPGEGQPSTDPIRDEARKRHYLSFFADNVALSFRKDTLGASPKTAGAFVPNAIPLGSSGPSQMPVAGSFAEQDQLLAQAGMQLAREEQLLQRLQQAGVSSTSGEEGSAPSSGNPRQSRTATPTQTPDPEVKEASSNHDPLPSAIKNSAPGKTYVIFEGTVLEALLVNRLDGSFSGPVTCLLSDNIYSHDRQHLLIPAGSKLLGEASKVANLGQTRLAVTFHRLIMPDGYSVSLDQFNGLEQEGATALKDKVNNHYTKIFGASLALGVLGGVAQIGTGSALTSTGTERMQEGFGVGMANAGTEVLDRFLNILPTVTIREGARVKIYLSNDLLLPEYSAHNLPANP